MSKPSEQRRVLQFIRDEKPDLVFLAPPCGPYSPLQHIMPQCPMKRWKKVQRLLAKRKMSKPLWVFTKQVMDECIQGTLEVKLVAVENPKPSSAWKMHDISGYPAYIDQCRFGLRLFKGKKFVKKPTTIMCSSPEYAEILTTRCTCPKRSDGRHDHIKGSFRSRDGTWISHSSTCGAWTPQLCEHFLQSAERVLRPDHHEGEVPAFVSSSCDFERSEQSFLGKTIENMYFEVFALDEDEITGNEWGDMGSQQRRHIRRLVNRLHVKYGHPSNPVLARTLRLGGLYQRWCKRQNEFHVLFVTVTKPRSNPLEPL